MIRVKLVSDREAAAAALVANQCDIALFTREVVGKEVFELLAVQTKPVSSSLKLILAFYLIGFVSDEVTSIVCDDDVKQSPSFVTVIMIGSLDSVKDWMRVNAFTMVGEDVQFEE